MGKQWRSRKGQRQGHICSGVKHENGVGLVLDRNMNKCVQEYYQLSDIILGVKMKGKAFNISIYPRKLQHTEEEIEMFHCTLDNAKTQCKSQEITIAMWDMDTKVDKERGSEIVCKFTRGTRNESRDKMGRMVRGE